VGKGAEFAAVGHATQDVAMRHAHTSPGLAQVA
jgi:hypothetical protein